MLKSSNTNILIVRLCTCTIYVTVHIAKCILACTMQSTVKIILDHIVEIQSLHDRLKAEQTMKKYMAQEIDFLKKQKPLSSDFGIQSVSGTN